MKRAALLALLLVAVVGADLPDVHVHDASSASLYNEACPLARLAVPAWGLPALVAETLPGPYPVSEWLVAPLPLERDCPARSPFAARAPPATV